MPSNPAFMRAGVLVVDDEAVIRKLTIKLLKQLGVRDVAETADGSEALRLLDKRNFDLILCDIHMDKLDGHGFAQSLRQGANVRYAPKKANTPIIFLTSSSDAYDVLQAKKVKAQGYLLKPLRLESLERKLAKVLGV
ncbi:response regulator [Yunchengibacter salinarum]|uniref:response regulator n=1 Tax=Yunchengibacter salinarum TaxID=3133399 RepID=UPI0035B656FD